MSVMWDDHRIEQEIEREWREAGNLYQYPWIRTLCRAILHDTEARLTMPKQVRLVLLACVREVIDAEGMTPALAAARDWLKEAKGAGNG